MDTCDSLRRAQPLLGTFVEIVAAGAAAGARQKAIDAAFRAVAHVHRLMSFHDPESDVSRMNQEAFFRTVTVNPWTYQVLECALELNRRSAGLFDIAVAPELQKRGLLPCDPQEHEIATEVTSARDQIELLGNHGVRFLDSRIRIDLGGIAKGFAVDRALEVLRDHGIDRGLVNAGGDLAAFGGKLEVVDIRNPKDAFKPLCRVKVQNAALASSAQSIEPLEFSALGECPIVDPFSGRRVHAVAGATVCAPHCMIADALTKVVMIAALRATELLKQYRASALLVLESRDVWITPDWQDAVRPAA